MEVRGIAGLPTLFLESPMNAHEEYLRAVIENVVEGVIAIDEDRTIEMFNPAAERMFGYSAPEAIGRNVNMLMPEPYASNHEEYVTNYLQTGRRKVIGIGREAQGRRNDGSIFPLFLSVSEMRVGKRRKFVGIVRDMSDITRIVAAMEETEVRFRTMADSAPVMIWVEDADGRCSYANRAWLRFSGRTMEQELGDGWMDKIHPDDLEPLLTFRHAMVEKHESYELEYRLKRFDGAYRWVLDKGVPRFDTEGLFVGYIGSCTDIHDFRTAEVALKKMTLLQSAVLDGANYSIISTTPDGIITTFNAVAERWLGYSADEVIGRATPALFHDPDEVARQAEELSRELGVKVVPGFEVFVARARLGAPDEREWFYLRKDGSRFPVLLSITCLYDENREVAGFLGIGADITEHKRTEETLLRLASIIESSDDAIVGKSMDGVIMSWNKGAENLYGYSASEVLGRHISIVAPSDRKDETIGIIERIKAGERVGHLETIRKTKDARFIEVSLTLSPIKAVDGSIVGISAIARDITKRKHAEEQVRKLSRAVEQSPVSVVITDKTGTIEYVNPKFTLITGYAREEAIGQNPRILKSGEKSPEDYRVLWETITSGNEWRGTFHNKKKSGELYWESASISPIKDSEGNVTHFIAVKEDITAIKAAQEELAKLSLVASKTDNAVIITDRDGLVEWVNDGFVRLTGYSLSDAIGKKPGHILQGPSTDPATVKRISKLLKSRINFTEEILNYHKNGHPYWVSMNVTPIFGEAGEPVGFISIESDVTERKKAEEALEQARESADAANRAKTEFLASMSHEIRTPMNAIVGMAELLGETPLNAEQTKYVQIFKSAGETLLNLINDILDISKVEAGQINLESIPFNLSELTEQLCEVIALRAHEKGIELACRIAPEVPAYLVGDPVRLRQILMNLMGNAIKFTAQGEVVLDVSTDASGPDVSPLSDPPRRRLRFTVRDTGIGIAHDKLGVVFDKFSQADSSITRKYGGTGLGLAICKKLVELMGGSIEVSSEEGKGSVFSCVVSFEVEPHPVEKREPVKANLNGVRVLVVDDNATNRIILKETLALWGAAVVEAESGERGIAELNRARDDGNPFRLVLLDRRMPGMDGFDVAERVKNDPSLAKVAIMMLTSDSWSVDAKRAREFNMAAYLVKPLKRADLRRAIDEMLGNAASSVVSSEDEKLPVTPSAEIRPLRILLVEDSATNRFLIRAYLKGYPYTVEEAENGEIAVQKFNEGEYDLVLMDMQMPILDGYGATRAIRERERDKGTPRIPIIALTAHALKDDEGKSIGAGCDAHMTKPIKKAELMKTILEHTAART